MRGEPLLSIIISPEIDHNSTMVNSMLGDMKSKGSDIF